MKKGKKHGWAWWLFIGWWWWLCFGIWIELIKWVCKKAKPQNAEKSKLPAPQTQTVKKKELYVYISLQGKKFHYLPDCIGLANSKRGPVRMELSKAKESGYTACDKCCYDYLHD